VSFGITSAALAIVGIVVLGALFVIKRQESALNLAANFREMGISELESNDPLAAEVFFSRALSIGDNIGARERLLDDDALLCVAISPNGEIVASAGWDDQIWIWDRRTAKRLRALTGHRGSILSLAFSPDGKWLVSGSEDRTVRLWDVEKGRHILTFPGHAGDVSSVSFLTAQDADELATGDVAGVVRLWDLSRIGQRSELTTLRGHDGGVIMISFDPVAPLLASGQKGSVWIEFEALNLRGVGRE
jgi:WD40 repeat protein